MSATWYCKECDASHLGSCPFETGWVSVGDFHVVGRDEDGNTRVSGTLEVPEDLIEELGGLGNLERILAHRIAERLGAAPINLRARDAT